MPSMTITTSGANATRFVAAVGKELNLDRNATAAEAKAFVKDYMKKTVKDSEIQPSLQAVYDNFEDIEVT